MLTLLDAHCQQFGTIIRCHILIKYNFAFHKTFISFLHPLLRWISYFFNGFKRKMNFNHFFDLFLIAFASFLCFNFSFLFRWIGIGSSSNLIDGFCWNCILGQMENMQRKLQNVRWGPYCKRFISSISLDLIILKMVYINKVSNMNTLEDSL